MNTQDKLAEALRNARSFVRFFHGDPAQACLNEIDAALQAHADEKRAAAEDAKDAVAKVTFVFPTTEHLDNFMGWFSDGGGEYECMQSSECHDDRPINHFDYSKAFRAHGYDPAKDGHPVIVAEVIDYDDQETPHD